MADKKSPLEAFSGLVSLMLAWSIALIVLVALLEHVWFWLVLLAAIGVVVWLGVHLLVIRRDRW